MKSKVLTVNYSLLFGILVLLIVFGMSSPTLSQWASVIALVVVSVLFGTGIQIWNDNFNENPDLQKTGEWKKID